MRFKCRNSVAIYKVQDWMYSNGYEKLLYVGFMLGYVAGETFIFTQQTSLIVNIFLMLLIKSELK